MQTRSGKTYNNASSSLKENKPKEERNVDNRTFDEQIAAHRTRWTERPITITSTSVSNSTYNRMPCVFTQPIRISNELAKFLGKPIGTEMARTEASRHINTYIRVNNLQDPQNGRNINPDTKLQKLLRLGKNDELTYFNLAKYMKPHFHRE